MKTSERHLIFIPGHHPRFAQLGQSKPQPLHYRLRKKQVAAAVKGERWNTPNAVTKCRAFHVRWPSTNWQDSRRLVVHGGDGADGKALYQEFFSRALPIASNAMNCSIMSGTLQKSSYALAFTITVLYFGIT